MTKILQSSWLTALVGGLLYLGVTLALVVPARFHVVRPAALPGVDTTEAEEPSWKFSNPEFDQWVEEIRRQRDALALREQQLQELQTRLQAERQEINVATQEVARLQADFDHNVIRIKDQEVDNIKHQAKIISGMSPDAAAGVLNEMPEDDAVKILVTMKPDDASGVLEALSKIGKAEAKRAAVFTEKIRRALPSGPNAGPKPSS